MLNNERFPLQPVYLTPSGQPRFRPNRIVQHLLDTGIVDMNKIAMMATRGMFTMQEQEQFAMLIGYSVGGFGELSYVSYAAYDEARERVEELLKESDHA